jgi:hypothetical protein
MGRGCSGGDMGVQRAEGGDLGIQKIQGGGIGIEEMQGERTMEGSRTAYRQTPWRQSRKRHLTQVIRICLAQEV